MTGRINWTIRSVRAAVASRFNRRLDELIRDGWFLAADDDDVDMRREATQVDLG